MPKSNNRRKLVTCLSLTPALTGRWAKPIIYSVTLPAHATTSLCKSNDLIGSWRFTSATHFVPALHPQFELFLNGSTSDADSEWTIIDTTFIMRQDVSDFTFRAPITANCDQLNGTSTTIFIGPPSNLPENGVWSAEKI